MNSKERGGPARNRPATKQTPSPTTVAAARICERDGCTSELTLQQEHWCSGACKQAGHRRKLSERDGWELLRRAERLLPAIRAGQVDPIDALEQALRPGAELAHHLGREAA